MNLAVLNKHKISEHLGEFFEFVQSIFDIGKLLQDFGLLCSEESNLKVGWLYQDELLDGDAHILLFLYVVYHTPHDSSQVPAPWLSLCQNRVPIEERLEVNKDFISIIIHREMKFSIN